MEPSLPHASPASPDAPHTTNADAPPTQKDSGTLSTSSSSTPATHKPESQAGDSPRSAAPASPASQNSESAPNSIEVSSKVTRTGPVTEEVPASSSPPNTGVEVDGESDSALTPPKSSPTKAPQADAILSSESAPEQASSSFFAPSPAPLPSKQLDKAARKPSNNHSLLQSKAQATVAAADAAAAAATATSAAVSAAGEPRGDKGVDEVAAAAAADAEALLASQATGSAGVNADRDSSGSLSGALQASNDTAAATAAAATALAAHLIPQVTSDPSLVSLLATAAARTLPSLAQNQTALDRAVTGTIPLANMVFAPLAAAFASTAAAFALGLVKAVLWTVVLLLFAVWWGQGYLLYVPTIMGRVGEKRQLRYNPPGARVPSDQGLSYEEYFLRTEDGVMLHAWFLPQPDGIRQTCPTVLYFHGNAGNVGNLLVSCRQMHRTLRCNTLVLDYRGYGNSQGSPTEHGLQLDALAAAGFVQRLAAEGRIAGDRVFLFGCSLGGAVALWLATRRPELFAGVIVENTFTSIEDMAIVLLSRVAPPGRFEPTLRAGLHVFMTSHWRSIDIVPTLTIPSLFFSGLADELVPAEHMRRLYDAAPDPERGGPEKVFHAVEGGEHNTTFYQGGQAYYDAYSRFISRHCSKTT